MSTAWVGGSRCRGQQGFACLRRACDRCLALTRCTPFPPVRLAAFNPLKIAQAYHPIIVQQTDAFISEWSKCVVCGRPRLT
jgi:NAD-dependent dihydropyrimidine dehydrogenase PreA subunit